MEDVCLADDSVMYSTDEIQSYKFKPGASIIVSIIIPTMAGFGLCFNMAFLFCVYRAPRMRTVINLFLVQLSVCDFSTLIFDTVRYLWVYIRSSGYDIQQGTIAGCTIFNFLFYFTYFVGVNFICLVTVERYFAICRPLKHRLFQGRSRARNLSISCWIVGVLLSVAALVPQKIVTICASFPNETTSHNETWMIFHSCQPACNWCFHVLYVGDTVQFLVVFGLTAVMYLAIVRKLRKRSGLLNPSGMDDKARIHANKISHDIARMLVINGVAFFTLLGPYQIWNIVLLIYDYTGVLILSEETLYWISWVSRLCAPVNFSMNPLIYGAINKQYRKAFIESFNCTRTMKTDDSQLDARSTTIESKTAIDTNI